MNKLISLILMIAISVSANLAFAASGQLKPYKGNLSQTEINLPDMQGNMHSLQDYQGNIVLVQFWATYCTPCRKEMPSMNKMMKKMGDVPFKILAVDMGETREEVSRFVNEVKPEFTILMDEDGKSIADWKVFAAPSNFIIDPQGKIRYTLFGGVEWDSDQLVNKLKALGSE